MFAAGRPLDRYSYGSRPLREEIVQTVGDAVVSRNLYGALVLNSPRAMFIDIDDDSPRALDRVRRWASKHPDLGTRWYRTAAGLRGLVASRTFEPTSDEALALLGEVGSDPLYVKLCKAQASFRARLTPKPWRCALRPPPSRWPFEDAGDEARFRAWQQSYEQASGRYAVCKPVETLGPATVHDEVWPILALHDQQACGDLPLA